VIGIFFVTNNAVALCGNYPSNQVKMAGLLAEAKNCQTLGDFLEKFKDSAGPIS